MHDRAFAGSDVSAVHVLCTVETRNRQHLDELRARLKTRRQISMRAQTFDSDERERKARLDPLGFTRRSLRKRALFRKFGERWKAQERAFQNRSYDSYEAYLEHQKAKLETHDFGQLR